MKGLYISQQEKSSACASFSFVLALLSLVLIIFVGPWASGIVSCFGFLIALGGLLLAYRENKTKNPATGYPLVVMGFHLLLLVLALLLYLLFLRPLSNIHQRMPRLQHLYGDPNGAFSVKGPAGWEYEPIVSQGQEGVRLKPADRSQYVGISEITVLVRKWDVSTESQKDFLEKMAVQLSEKKKASTSHFSFFTEPAQLLSGDSGLWSQLDAKKYWVPVRQTTLIGIKNKRYLCAVSSSGLKDHATLFRVFCLGLFHTIQVPSDKNN